MAKIYKDQIINKIHKSQMREDIPEFKAGDTISVGLKIIEGNKTRVQTFTGVVLKLRGKGTSKTCIVRKETDGVGVEETFAIYSPQIVKIEVLKHGKVRRAYISYMRQRSGKSARIEEKTKK